jgi:hypothetical protein
MESRSGILQSVPIAAGPAAHVLEHSKQAGGKATSVPDWQELCHGDEMRKVSETMSKTVGQYKLLVPELLFYLRGKDGKKQHDHVCQIIADALNRLEPPDRPCSYELGSVRWPSPWMHSFPPSAQKCTRDRPHDSSSPPPSPSDSESSCERTSHGSLSSS